MPLLIAINAIFAVALFYLMLVATAEREPGDCAQEGEF